ncbi:MAG: carbamate kinase [Bifidobacteriaceae bacterium]|jgi:carbamate kinase|nr:carbamate kinase [Bifidobacteriaceae bacterium]
MKIVIALGGNALGNNPDEQKEKVKIVADSIADLIKDGHNIVITHGNGPQVGAISNAFQIANGIDKLIPGMPLPESTAMSQGYIGFHLQQAFHNRLKKSNIVTLVTQVIVSPDDPAFSNPTKPIGAFITEEKAKQIMKSEPEKTFIEDSGRGWRQVVASPKPKRIEEIDIIKSLVDSGNLVIASGGGGVPVIEKDERLEAIDSVIDKDLSAAKLAEDLDADLLVILTAVEKVAINFGKANQSELRLETVSKMVDYSKGGHFAAGSMLPKVQAAVEFVKKANGKAVITSLENANNIFDEEKVTTIKKG